MTSKKRRRNLGKTIRQATGLLLPVAMRAAKFIDRGDRYEVLSHPLTESHVKVIRFSCDCCGIEGYALTGPRGDYKF